MLYFSKLASRLLFVCYTVRKHFLPKAIAHSGTKTMTSSPPKIVLCITSYDKGQDFIRECKRQGAYVILLTVTALENANWPRESIDEVFSMLDITKTDEVIRVVSF